MGQSSGPLWLLLIWAIIFLDIFMIFDNHTISGTKFKLKEGYVMHQNANSCTWGPTMKTVLDKCRCLPIGPFWKNLENFSIIFHTKSKLKGVLFMKLALFYGPLGPRPSAKILWLKVRFLLFHFRPKFEFLDE